MSSLKEYLQEATTKTYAYRIKIAGDCTEESSTVLENALQKYQLESMSTWKRTPIAHNPQEFLRRNNARFVSEVCDADVVLKYPVNERILEVYVAINLGIDLERVICFGIKEARLTASEIDAARVIADEGREVSQDDSVMSEDSEQEFSHYDDRMGEYPFGDGSESMFGETYNKAFLEELKKVKEEKGADYFRCYPTKDEIMGDNHRSLWDSLNNMPNMGKGDPDGTKEADVISQASRRN
jgi:hypothetical protein